MKSILSKMISKTREVVARKKRRSRGVLTQMLNTMRKACVTFVTINSVATNLLPSVPIQTGSLTRKTCVTIAILRPTTTKQPVKNKKERNKIAN